MKNPYVTTLTAITVVLFVIAGTLYIVAASSGSEFGGPTAKQLGFQIAAGSWLGYACISLLATLLLAGLTWKAAEPRPTAPPERD